MSTPKQHHPILGGNRLARSEKRTLTRTQQLAALALVWIGYAIASGIIFVGAIVAAGSTLAVILEAMAIIVLMGFVITTFTVDRL